MKVKIEKLIFGGLGLARQEDGRTACGERGRTIFVYKSVPEDELEVDLIEDKKSFAKGKITRILKPSPYRIEPKCPYFDNCGGCEHQNISYKDQLRFKEEVFKETLERQGIKTKIEPIVAGSTSEFYYRNSIRFFFVVDNDNQIQFSRHNYLYNKGFVEIKKCLLQSETADLILEKLKDYINNNVENKSSFWQLKIREGKFTDQFMVEIITKDYDLPNQQGIVESLKSIESIKSIYHTIALGKSLRNLKRRLIFGSPIIYEKIGKYKFQISPESFFQTNSMGVENLYNHIKSYADIKMGETVLDLYCGTGTIGIYLSATAKEVIGVEFVREAISDAKDNSKINNIQNCEFVCADVEKWLSKLQTANRKPQTIIVDPPRAGLSKEIVKKISTISFEKIVYVSCNPSTFARDIKEFEKYDIILQKVVPIDMFPQTHHIECVGLLKNK